MNALPRVLLLALLAAPLAAQDLPAPGQVAERLTARADTTQAYALYLPAAYSADRTWPVLFLMDPRGRALVPLGLFREASERHGFVLMSSYNTLSDADSATQINERALTALLEEAQDRIALDPRRLYLAGFSGTARISWSFADRLRPYVAGVVGVGAGLPGNTEIMMAVLRDAQPFAFFGTAGELDFNHDEMRALDEALDATPVPHRFVWFDGGHSWPPAAVATEAGDWLHLRAIAAGLAPPDSPFVAAQLAARLERARALEAESPADALAEYRSAAADFAGLGDVGPALRRAAELERSGAVRRTLARRAELARRALEFQVILHEVLAEIRTGEVPPPERAAERLRLARLR
ncbi:MAG TPA: hypothetical protein VFX98_04400, partial [Longimicrobiaceae bacterium]|nr:hypothetical protein [Longimicrobiaceae bacterium]